MVAVDTERALIALDKIEGFAFERFANEFFSSLRGMNFVPLGGYHDGGADGFEANVSVDDSGKYFIQASIRSDVSTKIDGTIKRLLEYGRTPVSLTYICSKVIQSIDTLESDLIKKHDVTIIIRDAKYIANQINHNLGTQTSYLKHLHNLTASMDTLGSSTLITPSIHAKDPSVIVFLSNEVERRSGDPSLVHSVIDSLILWALELTDPDLDVLMSESEILVKILSVLPSVENLVRSRLHARLMALAKKDERNGRAIRHYRKRAMFCLPFETRNSLKEENVADESLMKQVAADVEARINSIPDHALSQEEIYQAKSATIRSLQITFERQGLSFSSSLHGQTAHEVIVAADSIAQSLDSFGINGTLRERIGRIVLDCLRGILYESTVSERTYLHKLSRTYSLLFTLNVEPRLINFFEQMAGNFYLYVGTDQLVQALSERYLKSPDQTVTNTLKMTAAAGGKLILTEPALAEVWNNLRTSDFEFKNQIAAVEGSIDYEIARNSPKILVRAYLYARLRLGSHERPSNWESFVNQFCNYNDLHKPIAVESLKRYLIREFSLQFVSKENLIALVSQNEFNNLSSTIKASEKKKEVLIDNDVLTVLSVYGHRRRESESSSTSDFGYQTWWLTNETRILDYTHSLILSQGGQKFIMRPDFLLNFLTLAPAAATVRQTYSAIFPTLLGITLSRRLSAEEYEKLLSKTLELGKLSEARKSAEIANLVDKLKGDQLKKYLASGGEDSSTFGVDAVARIHIDEEFYD